MQKCPDQRRPSTDQNRRPTTINLPINAIAPAVVRDVVGTRNRSIALRRRLRRTRRRRRVASSASPPASQSIPPRRGCPPAQPRTRCAARSIPCQCRHPCHWGTRTSRRGSACRGEKDAARCSRRDAGGGVDDGEGSGAVSARSATRAVGNRQKRGTFGTQKNRAGNTQVDSQASVATGGGLALT